MSGTQSGKTKESPESRSERATALSSDSRKVASKLIICGVYYKVPARAVAKVRAWKNFDC